jgi:glutamine amidotransferase
VILILDCGVGNFLSIARMITIVGGKCYFGHSQADIDKAKKIIIPGVGSFDNGIKMIKSALIFDKIKNKINSKDVIVLGICLGMQLLCRSSEEGSLPGLGVIAADNKKIEISNDKKLKIPHVGWNIVTPVRPNKLIYDTKEQQRFYFVHSYKVVPDDPNIVIGKSYYGNEFCSAFQKDNIYGVQFHPEKSHRFGLELIKRFVQL